jgi:hypothetical protein
MDKPSKGVFGGEMRGEMKKKKRPSAGWTLD